jgi:hypothetical protein
MGAIECCVTVAVRLRQVHRMNLPSKASLEQWQRMMSARRSPVGPSVAAHNRFEPHELIETGRFCHDRITRGIMQPEAVMQGHLEIPEDLAKRLAPEPGDLTRTAIEAVALEGVRSGKLTASQGHRLLGLESRYEMDGFLKAHGIFLDLTLERFS